MGYHGCWDDVAFAEEHGFATAGFVDSPLLAGDPFVCMTLAARATERMRVGTMLAIPELRRAPTNAAAIATVNAIAPGRTFLGLGSGFTGRAVFGMPRLPVAVLRDHALECRALLDGGEVEPPMGTLTNSRSAFRQHRGPLHRHRPPHPDLRRGRRAEGARGGRRGGRRPDRVADVREHDAEQRRGLLGVARARSARPPAPRAAPPMTSTRCGRSACACSRRASPRSRLARSSRWVPAR